jgi:hypothetical protein
MQYECQPSLSVACYSILQYITATRRQYGYQPGVSVVYYRQYGYQPGMSVVYYSILQTRPADSRIAGWYPLCIVVYYSIPQTGPADSRIVGW